MLKSLGLWKSSYAPIPHFSGPLFYPEAQPLVMSTQAPPEMTQVRR